jgi:hypothetical protein
MSTDTPDIPDEELSETDLDTVAGGINPQPLPPNHPPDPPPMRD